MATTQLAGEVITQVCAGWRPTTPHHRGGAPPIFEKEPEQNLALPNTPTCLSRASSSSQVAMPNDHQDIPGEDLIYHSDESEEDTQVTSDATLRLLAAGLLTRPPRSWSR